MPIVYRNINGTYQIGYSNVILPLPVSKTVLNNITIKYPFNSDLLDYSTGSGVSNLTALTTFPSATATIATSAPYSTGKGYLNISANAPEFYLSRTITITPPFSVSCWFKINSADYTNNGKSIQYVRLMQIGNKIGFWFNVDGSMTFITYLNGETGGQTQRGFASNVANNAWHHFVVTLDSNFNLKVYLDNASVLNYTFAASPTNLNSSSGLVNASVGLVLLRNPGDGTFYYWGSMGSFIYYNKLLTIDEINYIYTNKL